MSNKVKTVKISTLIKRLQELLVAEGDLPIVIAKNTEGNGYNTIDPNDDIDYSVDDNVLVLYPSSEIKHITDTINDMNDDDDSDEPKSVDEFDWSYDSYDDSEDDDNYYEDDCY